MDLNELALDFSEDKVTIVAFTYMENQSLHFKVYILIQVYSFIISLTPYLKKKINKKPKEAGVIHLDKKRFEATILNQSLFLPPHF